MKYLSLALGISLMGCSPNSNTARSAELPCSGEALLAKRAAALSADVVVTGIWKLSDPKFFADGIVAIGEITPNAVNKGSFDRSIPVSIMTGEVATSAGETLQCAVSKPQPQEIRIFFLRRAEKYYEVVDHRSDSES